MTDPRLPRSIDRRRFLVDGLGTFAGLAMAERIWADPFTPLPEPPVHVAPRRVRGVVQEGGRGLPGVAVSDGLQVSETAADGTFELITSSSREFVQISVPSGYRIPTNKMGIARFYEPLSRTGSQAEVRFELNRLEGSDSVHTLLLLADLQTQTRQELRWLHTRTVPDVERTLQELGAGEVFGIADGDIMYDNLELYPEYERAVSRMGVPFFQVVGNHDLDFGPSDGASTRTFCGRFGPRYYSFDRGAVHYVVLDDVFWYGSGFIGYLSDEMLTWLRNDVAHIETGRTVIVATHIPALGSFHLRQGEANPAMSATVANRDELYRLLEPYATHILTGHTHENEHLFEHGTHEHISGAVCGAWWSGPICWDGTPSGYSVYEIRGEEVTWRYKATGFGSDHQLRAYPRGADPGAPNEVVANVWNWDPEWTVLWYENGARRGPMARRLGIDPLSVYLHAGEELPLHRPWVDPRPTNHMFYAPVPLGSRDVVIEATDRFGRTYSEPVPMAG